MSRSIDVIVNGVSIDDTFAEAFAMRGTRVIITAHTPAWARQAAVSMTGFATSVIGCGVEAGIERELDAAQTPDGRPGVAVLLFATSSSELAKQLERRVGQCVLTTPTSAVFSGIEAGRALPLGKTLRYFGDGYQISKVIGGRRYWRVPVMDGEFIAEDTAAMSDAIGGGNFIILAAATSPALAAAEAAIEAMRRVSGAIMPFPGGVARSGSKVGSKYKTLIASTNDAFCPTLRASVDSELGADVECVYEIVIDGLTEQAVRDSMQAGLRAVCAVGAAGGIRRLSAGNYDGKLGKFHFPLRALLP
ncbi:MAG TPA: formylmethanofuran--tetrahydromethanopterin N-formyltransferase [Burkholderiaceae bacterium]|nr:formylmethanofuran--tetrahydromethanopterin N-formyltransferase [Burkholderiaceae bacterium]